MDTAENMDNHGAGGGSLAHALAHEPISQEHAEAGAGVRFQQEEHGFAHFLRLLDAQGSQDAVVDGVIEEQNLRRLDKEGGQGQHAHGDDALHTGPQDVVACQHHGAYTCKGHQGQKAAQDTCGEIVYQHLEAAGDGVGDGIIEFLDAPAAEGTHNHCSQEHGDVGACDNACGGDGAHHAAPVAVDGGAAGEAYQERYQPFRHGAAGLGQILIGQPARGDKEGCEQTPADEGADVRHDHAGQEAAKFLHGLLGTALLCTHFSSSS